MKDNGIAELEGGKWIAEWDGEGRVLTGKGKEGELGMSRRKFI